MIPFQRSIVLITLCVHLAVAQEDASYICQPPQMLGMISGLDNPASLTIEGDYAYIAQSDDSFLIVDISDPMNPVLLADADDLPIDVNDGTRIVINQGAAYVGNAIINIEDKTDPWFMRYGAITSRPLINGFFYLRSPAYFDRTNIYNATRPYAIGIDSFEDPDAALGFIFGGLPVAYVNGLLVTDRLDRFNIDNPHAPVLVDDSNYDNIYTIDEYRFDEPYLLFLEDSSNVDPTINIYQKPIDIFTTIEFDNIPFSDLTVHAENMFLLNAEGLQIYALSNEPSLVASHTDDPLLASAQFIRQHNDHFVLVSENTFAIYDIPTNPISGVRTILPQSHLELMGDTAILSTGNIDTSAQGASVVDISNPANPRWVSELPVNDAFGIDSIAPYAFVANKTEGLMVFDLSDPFNPLLETSYNTSVNQAGTPNTRDIYITGDYAYTIDRNAGLAIYQIVNDHELQPISTLAFTQAVQRITVDGDLAFVSGLSRLYIVNMVNPATPFILSSIDELPGTTNYIHSATRQGNLLYTADSNNGYRIFDISDPATPAQIAHFDADVSTKQGVFEAFAYELIIENDLLYIAMSFGGFAIYDNTDPFNPVLLRHAPAALPPANNIARYRDLEIRGNHLYTAAGNAGLRVYDLNDCALPCAIDFNNDGNLNFFDVSIFLVAFGEGDPLADLQPDGNFNFFDVAAFITAYQTGCP